MENENFNEEINISNEFADINEKNKYKDYIIVGILYLIVIILSVFLFLGLKNQKDIITNANNSNNVEVKNIRR